jgi:hypothetical protein
MPRRLVMARLQHYGGAVFVGNGALVLDGVAISNSSADVRPWRSRAAIGTRGGGAGQTGGACRKKAAQCP